MKYEVGTIVKIVSNIRTAPGRIVGYNPSMEKHQGSCAKIVEVDYNRGVGIYLYHLDVDNGIYVWDSSLFNLFILNKGKYDEQKIVNTIEKPKGIATTDWRVGDISTARFVDVLSAEAFMDARPSRPSAVSSTRYRD